MTDGKAGQTAADAARAALASLPDGVVASRADALRVVEAIELLLDGGHWAEADDLYVSRCDTGRVFRHLPAARLGQRAASAFVATPDRRAACLERLSPDDLSFYLNETGLHAMFAGDMAAAREYLPAALEHDRGIGNTGQMSLGLRNLAECLGRLGLAGPALEAATEALDWAERSLNDRQVRDAHACLAWAAGLGGDTARAEQHFLIADQLEVEGRPAGYHLYSNRGVWWAEWLDRTGRRWAARLLTEDNESLCYDNGWTVPLGRCERLLGQFVLADDDLDEAANYLDEAVSTLRDGDYLPDLAEALPALAEWSQADGDPDAATRHLAEAIAIAAPRGLIPAHITALTTRARLRATQASITEARADASTALDLATTRNLPWSELEALRAHATLDEAEDKDNGWSARATALESKLIPPGLDRDPMKTVERQAAGAAQRDSTPGQPPEL